LEYCEFPVLLSDTSFASIFSGVGFYQVLTWTGSSYVTPIDVQPGKAYWVLILSSASVIVSGSPVESFSITLSPGWSMMGNVYGVSVSCSSVFDPNYYQFETWTGTGYAASSTIDPGRGYWALVLNSTSITMHN